MNKEELLPLLESLIFISDKPVGLTRFSETLQDQASKEEIEIGLQELIHKYQQEHFGIELRLVQGGYQFCTKAKFAETIRKFLSTKPFRLGRSTLETLAIIAYKQPVTRSEIDQIRGLDSSHLLRTLVERGLVRMVGKAEVPGRPVQYGTAPKFLEVVGLNQLADLPPLSELEQLQGHTEEPEDLLERNLDSFIQEAPKHTEIPDDSNEIVEIENLIDNAGDVTEEVYESALHAEVGRENVFAVQSFQEFSKQHKRQLKRNQALMQSELPPEASA